MVPCALQIRKTQRDNRAIFADKFRHVSHGADGDHLEKARHLRFAPALTKQRLNQFESDADAGEILVRIIAAVLIRIQYGQRRRRASVGVGLMMSRPFARAQCKGSCARMPQSTLTTSL